MGHPVQRVAPLPSVLMVIWPGPQAKHAALPVVLEKVPGAQRLQVWEPVPSANSPAALHGRGGGEEGVQ